VECLKTSGQFLEKSKEVIKGVQGALGGKAHSDAYAEALEEIKPSLGIVPAAATGCVLPPLECETQVCAKSARPMSMRSSFLNQTHLTVEQLGQRLSEHDLTKRYGYNYASSSGHVC